MIFTLNHTFPNTLLYNYLIYVDDNIDKIKIRRKYWCWEKLNAQRTEGSNGPLSSSLSQWHLQFMFL